MLNTIKSYVVTAKETIGAGLDVIKDPKIRIAFSNMRDTVADLKTQKNRELRDLRHDYLVRVDKCKQHYKALIANERQEFKILAKESFNASFAKRILRYTQVEHQETVTQEQPIEQPAA